MGALSRPCVWEASPAGRCGSSTVRRSGPPLEGRYPHVKGEPHPYEIHLGSGNILMSPNDRYLCLVPKSGSTSGNGNRTTPTGHLPSEGDRMLAVVLSKAMSLAKDREITDPTILSQR